MLAGAGIAEALARVRARTAVRKKVAHTVAA
jgi:hypothetical protein